VIGSLAGLRWRPRHPIRFAMSWAALWPPSFALFALGPPLWVLVPLFVVVGFSFAMFDVSLDTAIAERIPPHAISRVSAFDWMGSGRRGCAELSRIIGVNSAHPRHEGSNPPLPSRS
jgi:hypothetical protein